MFLSAFLFYHNHDLNMKNRGLLDLFFLSSLTRSRSGKSRFWVSFFSKILLSRADDKWVAHFSGYKLHACAVLVLWHHLVCRFKGKNVSWLKCNGDSMLFVERKWDECDMYVNDFIVVRSSICLFTTDNLQLTISIKIDESGIVSTK